MDDLDVKDIKSDFNEASLQIFRLHSLWNEANRHSKSGHLIDWRWTLDNIWRELANDAHLFEKRKKTDYKKNNIMYNKMIQKYTDDKKRLYLVLSKKEIFLRSLQDDVGKGSKRDYSSDRMM